MKSYTDLNQSRKLAEILPPESADMAWYSSYAKEGYSIRMLNETYPLDIIGEEHDEIPAWSLSALLDILPEISGVNLKFERVKAEDGYEGYYYHIEYKDKILIPYSKNPIDACYEMILNLHEQKIWNGL